MLKAAQVGLGWWGRRITLCLRGSDEIKVTCGVDPSQESAGEYAAAFGLPVYPELSRVLADPGIEAVILTTPHGLHEQQVIAAAAAGKQVFCEKPLSLSADSVRRMLEACDRAGIILGVGHERRFEPGWEEIKRMSDAGELGTIMHVEGNFSHDRSLGLVAGSWRGSRAEAPAAGMTGRGVHLTDFLLSVLGPAEAVHALTAQRVLDLPTGDVVSVHLRFGDDTTGHIAAVSATPFYSRIAVFGSHGWAESRDTQHVDPGGPAHLFTRLRGDAEQGVRTYQPRNVVKANLEEWAAAVTGKGSYRFTNSERFGNIALLEAIARSAETNTVETVPQY